MRRALRARGTGTGKTVTQRFMRHLGLRIAVLALTVGAGLSLSACGRRGDLEPPAGAENPAPPPGSPRPAPQEGERPDKPFILDGIL